MGVGAPALLAWMGPGAHVSAEMMRELPLSTYELIARNRYWMPLGCSGLPAGLDLMAFDFGWNRGVTTSRDILARCLDIDPCTAGARLACDVADEVARAPLEPLLQSLSRAGVRSLQQALGITDDGIAGPETVGALRSRADMRVSITIMALSTAQMRSYRQLINFPVYGAGWLARSARRQAAALAAAKAIRLEVAGEALHT